MTIPKADLRRKCPIKMRGVVWDGVEASGSPKYLIKEQTVCLTQTSDKRHKLVACGVSGSKYFFASLAYTRGSDSKVHPAFLLGLFNIVRTIWLLLGLAQGNRRSPLGNYDIHSTACTCHHLTKTTLRCYTNCPRQSPVNLAPSFHATEKLGEAWERI